MLGSPGPARHCKRDSAPGVGGPISVESLLSARAWVRLWEFMANFLFHACIRRECRQAPLRPMPWWPRLRG